MTAAAPLSAPLQRAHGEAEVVLSAGRLARLYQRGSAKAITLVEAARAPEIVFLNTAGGLTGGDRLRYALTTDRDATATTQTAERGYRSLSGAARLDVALSVGAGHLDWLPQETILYDAAALTRRTVIDLGPSATCLALEMLVLGRAAMGETVTRLSLDDRRSILRAGRPVAVDPLLLDGGALQHPALVGGARALASLVLVAPHAPDLVTRARATLDEPGVTGAASGFDGRLSVRLMAADGWPLRRQVARLLAALRPATPLPRVWQIQEAR